MTLWIDSTHCNPKIVDNKSVKVHSRGNAHSHAFSFKLRSEVNFGNKFSSFRFEEHKGKTWSQLEVVAEAEKPDRAGSGSWSGGETVSCPETLLTPVRLSRSRHGHLASEPESVGDRTLVKDWRLQGFSVNKWISVNSLCQQAWLDRLWINHKTSKKRS